MSRLQKAIDTAKGVSAGNDRSLQKGEHDAMAHHALHAKAARVAGDKQAERQHEHALLRHALHHAHKACTSPTSPTYSSMSSMMQRNVNHHTTNADDEIGYSYGGDETKAHPAVKHHREKKGFVAHASDTFGDELKKKKTNKG